MSEATIFIPVVEAYDRWSGFYDSYENPMVFGASQIVERLAAQVTGQDVLEFGCGTGRNLVRLKQGGAARLMGCDFSAGMLAQAKARDSQLLLWQQDIKQPLPLADGVVDLALFSLTLEHMDDLLPPLAEARRLVRPAGKIAVVEIHPFMSLGGIAAHFRDKETIVEMPTVPHRFSDYLNAAAMVGMSVAECREWRPRDFEGPVPDKVQKRGQDFPLLVEFTLRRA